MLREFSAKIHICKTPSNLLKMAYATISVNFGRVKRRGGRV